MHRQTSSLISHIRTAFDWRVQPECMHARRIAGNRLSFNSRAGLVCKSMRSDGRVAALHRWLESSLYDVRALPVLLGCEFGTGRLSLGSYCSPEAACPRASRAITCSLQSCAEWAQSDWKKRPFLQNPFVARRRVSGRHLCAVKLYRAEQCTPSPQPSTSQLVALHLAAYRSFFAFSVMQDAPHCLLCRVRAKRQRAISRHESQEYRVFRASKQTRKRRRRRRQRVG